LSFLLHALEVIPSRIIMLGQPTRPQLLVYSDAATRPEGLRVGFLICERGQPSICSVYDVPESVVATWKLRKQYIGQGELLAGPLCAATCAEKLRDRDLTWYVDNVSAVASLIKGSSPQADSSALALVAALTLASLSCRVWVEYIDTHQHPADRLSRDGYDDEYVKKQVSAGEWSPFQPVVRWSDIANYDLAAPNAHLQRWGARLTTP